MSPCGQWGEIIKTYQDLMAARGTETLLKQFILDAIAEHKASPVYHDAVSAELYASGRNETITKYQKLLYTLTGKAVPDRYSANHKCASGFYKRFLTQEVQYLLGNGAFFADTAVKDHLGGAKFDNVLQRAGRYARMHGTAFLYFNFDNVKVFKLTEFVPLYDEENGALRAGVRFWQISDDRPMRADLYETDGVTEYIKKPGGDMEVLRQKHTYTQVVRHTAVDGAEIFDGQNYPGFPVVPFYGDENHLSSLVGLRENIDAYDLIKSGFANDLDDASLIYWTISNAGGMDEIDLAKFVERMKSVHAAQVGDDQKAEAHTLEVPYQSRETCLTRIKSDLYGDAMALDIDALASSNATATQIMAAYEPLNQKTDLFEYCVLDALGALLAAAGLPETEITFNRSQIINQKEETETVLMAAQYLDDETLLSKLSWLTYEEKENVLARRDKQEAARFGA